LFLNSVLERAGHPPGRLSRKQLNQAIEGGGRGTGRDGLNVFDSCMYITNRLLNLIIWFSWKDGNYYTKFKLLMPPFLRLTKCHDLEEMLIGFC
jgi:hypothetical protein